jgi:hypothetical protein
VTDRRNLIVMGSCSLEQQITLHFHAAQLFAMGGMNERAITHLDWVESRSQRFYRVVAPREE